MPNLLHPTHGQWFILCVEAWLKCSSWIQHWLISMPSYTLGNLQFIWEMPWSTLLGHRRLEVETRTKRKKKILYRRLVLFNQMSCFPKDLKNRNGQNICRDAPKMHVFLKRLLPLTSCLFISLFVFRRQRTFSLLRHRKQQFFKWRQTFLERPNKRFSLSCFVWALNPWITNSI